MMTAADVHALLKRGPSPDYGSVCEEVVERISEERGFELYDDFYDAFTKGGYDLDFQTFLANCDGHIEFIDDEFIRGVVDVLELAEEERMAFALAITFGRVWNAA